MRSAFICQSQSLNLFMEDPNIGKLSSMYMYAWKQGVKTTYYLRSRARTSIKKRKLRERRTESLFTVILFLFPSPARRGGDHFFIAMREIFSTSRATTFSITRGKF